MPTAPLNEWSAAQPVIRNGQTRFFGTAGAAVGSSLRFQFSRDGVTWAPAEGFSGLSGQVPGWAAFARALGVGSAGTFFVEGTGQAGIVPAAPDLDWLSLRSNVDWTLQSIPSPYSPAVVVHPSVVYFPAGWRGYQYWMAHTPYPGSDPEFENPCICCSNDGVNWISVGRQPLFDSPPSTAYNSDVDLAYDFVNDRLVLLYRVVGVPTSTDMRLVVSTSLDGGIWTTPVIIYTGTGVATSNATDIVSPSLMFNTATGRWEILGHQARDNGSAWPFVKLTSLAVDSGWDAAVTTLTFPVPSGRKWWHSQFRRLASGAYIGLVQDNDGIVGNSGNLYAAYSSDGINFSSRLLEDVLVTGQVGFYRPSFVLLQLPQTSAWVCQAFVSRIGQSGIQTQTLRFDAVDAPLKAVADLTSALNAGILGGQGRLVLHSDTFNRADDATGLGTASGGGTYTQPGGPTDVIGISSNQAYNVTTGNCRAVRDMGRINYAVRCTLITKSVEQWVIVRYIDSANFVRVGVNSGSSQLIFQRVTGGSAVVDLTLGVTPANGDEVLVTCAGAEIVIYLNGRRVSKQITVQGTLVGALGTFMGIAMSGTLGGRMDNLVCTALA